MYTNSIYESKTLVFEPEYRQCPYCHKRIQKHIICDGARWHFPHWDNHGEHCSESDCEINHRNGKCNQEKG
jgi:hypothetical protein